MQYMDKPNEKYIKSFEIKMAWWLTSPRFPQGNEDSILIMAKLNKSKWGKWGDFKRPDWIWPFDKKIFYYRFQTWNQVVLAWIGLQNWKNKNKHRWWQNLPFILASLANSSSIFPLRAMSRSTSTATQKISTFSPSSSSFFTITTFFFDALFFE